LCREARLQELTAAARFLFNRRDNQAAYIASDLLSLLIS
jgi:hypothetical protein